MRSFSQSIGSSTLYEFREIAHGRPTVIARTLQSRKFWCTETYLSRYTHPYQVLFFNSFSNGVPSLGQVCSPILCAPRMAIPKILQQSSEFWVLCKYWHISKSICATCQWPHTKERSILDSSELTWISRCNNLARW